MSQPLCVQRLIHGRLDLVVVVDLLLLLQHQLSSTSVHRLYSKLSEGHSKFCAMIVTTAISVSVWAAVSVLIVHYSSFLLLLDKTGIDPLTLTLFCWQAVREESLVRMHHSLCIDGLSCGCEEKWLICQYRQGHVHIYQTCKQRPLNYQILLNVRNQTASNNQMLTVSQFTRCLIFSLFMFKISIFQHEKCITAEVTVCVLYKYVLCEIIKACRNYNVWITYWGLSDMSHNRRWHVVTVKSIR